MVLLSISILFSIFLNPRLLTILFQLTLNSEMGAKEEHLNAPFHVFPSMQCNIRPVAYCWGWDWNLQSICIAVTG